MIFRPMLHVAGLGIILQQGSVTGASLRRTQDADRNLAGDTDCASALQAYRASNGTNYTTVGLACLTTPECKASAPAALVMQCDFNEVTTNTIWGGPPGDCFRNSSQSSSDRGTLVSIIRDHLHPEDGPMISQIASYSHDPFFPAGEILEWGFTTGCTGDKDHVYVLFRNPVTTTEEGVYQVIGYQSLSSFLDGGVLVGDGLIGGIATSSAPPPCREVPCVPGCASGGSEVVNLEGTCQASNHTSPVDTGCAAALLAFRESDGTNYTTVELDCLMAPTCGASPPPADEIVCDFDEHRTDSWWGPSDGECFHNTTESSEELGSLLSFSKDDFPTNGGPLFGRIANYSYAAFSGNETVPYLEWGFTTGCHGDENHVYLLFRNPHMRPEEAVYEVIGHQSLDEFLNSSAVLQGQGDIGGMGISGAPPPCDLDPPDQCPTPCAFGSSFFVKMEGTCEAYNSSTPIYGDSACAIALQEYHESNGTQYTRVNLTCLESPSCGATVPMAKGLTCNFTERETWSQWSGCNTVSGVNLNELGTALSFSAADFPANRPLVGTIQNYSYEEWGTISTYEWGVTTGCGGDNHVYTLFKHVYPGAEEDAYDVIGYQSLPSFVGGASLEGVGAIGGMGMSNSGPPGGCPSGHQYFFDMLGSCQLDANSKGAAQSGGKTEGRSHSSANPGKAPAHSSVHKVPSTLTFHFRPGRGKSLGNQEKSLLTQKTMDFFKSALQQDSKVKATFSGVTFDPSTLEFKETGADTFSLSFDAFLTFDETVTQREAVSALAGANWNQYIHQYVHQGKASHSPLNRVQSVVFRGVGYPANKKNEEST